MTNKKQKKEHCRRDFQVEALPLVSEVGKSMKRGPTERRGEGGVKRKQSLSFLYQSVDVMLGTVLTVGHLEHARHTQQRLLGVPVRHHLPEQREGGCLVVDGRRGAAEKGSRVTNGNLSRDVTVFKGFFLNSTHCLGNPHLLAHFLITNLNDQNSAQNALKIPTGAHTAYSKFPSNLVAWQQNTKP